MTKRKPLEFDDPYDEDVSSSGGSNWSAVTGNRPTRRKSREDEWNDFLKAVSNEGKCPSCFSISTDFAIAGVCFECGYES